MLMTNRRHRLLFIALAGLELSWYMPLIGLLLAYWAPRSPHADFERLALLTTQPLIAFALLWGVMLLYMLLVDWLNAREIDTPLRQIAMLAALVAATMVAVMFLLYPLENRLTLRPLAGLAAALFEFTAGVRPELVLLLLNFFLWFRVAAFTDRDISFFSVGLTFRVAMLLALIANGFLTTLGGQPPAVAIQYFALTISVGLLAVAMARVDDKAQGVRNSTGALLPWSRVLHILLLIALTVFGALGLAQIFTPDLVRTVLGWTLPLWQLLGVIFSQVLIVILVAITPFFEWLAALIQARFTEMPPMEPMQPMRDDSEVISLGEVVDRSALLRYCLVTGIIAAAVGLLWLFFVRTQRRLRSDEAEEATREENDADSGGLNLGLDRLRAWLHLLRRYGLGAQLLAAVSVENIYANVLRMAAAKGVKRRPAVSPDRFLPALAQAFPQQENALRRITVAYMRVYYGNREIDAAELQQVRADYQSLRDLPPPDVR